MRSARMILASAAAAAALAIATPGAHASGGDESHDDSSYSKTDDSSHGKGDDSSHGKGDDSSHSKDQGDSHSKENGDDSSHDEPRGGMHTGGGALTALTSDDWSSDSDSSKYDPETYKDKGSDSGSDHDKGSDSDSGRGKDSWDDDTDKPSGGMHTGGGGLATPGGVTTGGLAVLAVGATGLYALRRKNAAESAA